MTEGGEVAHLEPARTPGIIVTITAPAGERAIQISGYGDLTPFKAIALNPLSK